MCCSWTHLLLWFCLKHELKPTSLGDGWQILDDCRAIHFFFSSLEKALSEFRCDAPECCLNYKYKLRDSASFPLLRENLLQFFFMFSRTEYVLH